MVCAARHEEYQESPLRFSGSPVLVLVEKSRFMLYVCGLFMRLHACGALAENDAKSRERERREGEDFVCESGRGKFGASCFYFSCVERGMIIYRAAEFYGH